MRDPWKMTTRGLLIVGFAALPAAAQDTEASPKDPGVWKVSSTIGLNLTQSSFNSAWDGNEVGTVSWALNSNTEVGKRLTPWANWLNTLVLQFGQTHQQDASRKRWRAPVKSSDKITYRGVVRFKSPGYVDPFVALDLDSQFFQEDTALSATRLFTPTVVTQSAGVARAFLDRGERRVISRLGFAARERIDRLTIAAGSLEPSTETTVESGIEWLTESRLAVSKERTVLSSELRVFKALTTSDDNPATRLHWPAFDIDWQNTLTNKVTEWFSFSLFLQLLYDKQIDVRGQFKQTLGAGFNWTLL